MKFGSYLNENILNPWRTEYIQYNLLKQDLKQRQLDHTWNEKDEADFSLLFSNERNKVSHFIGNYNQQIISRIQYAEHLLKSSIINRQTSFQQQQTIEFLNTVDDSLLEIICDVFDFTRFVDLNKTGFAKMLKKHKKWTSIEHENNLAYESKAIDTILTSQWHSSFYTQASLLRSQCYQKFGGATPNDSVKVPATEPARRSTKYWIHPYHVSEVTAILSMHMSVLQPTAQPEEKSQSFDFSMSNIYYDNANFDCYLDMLENKQDIQTINCKKYGLISSDDSLVYFENVKHSTHISEIITSKKRIRAKQATVLDFCKSSGENVFPPTSTSIVKGNIEEDLMDIGGEFAREIETEINRRNLAPVIRCDYQRIMFNQPSFVPLLITLDTDIEFIQPNNDLSLVFSKANNQENKTPFLYSVLEVKLPVEADINHPSLQWLNQFTQKSNLVHEIPKFSEYLHGIYELYSAENSKLMPPSWAIKYKNGISISQIHSGLSRSRSLRPLLNGKPFRSTIPYSAAGNINIERSQRKSQQQLSITRPLHPLMQSSTSFYSTSSGEFTAISIGNQFDKEKTSIENTTLSNYKMECSDQKIEVNYLPPLKENPSRSFFSLFSKKSNFNKNKTILDQDGNPIEFKTQKKNKKGKTIKIEPKVFFANERTFISWLQFCALLLTVSLNLLNFGDQVSKVCGGIFLFISMMLALYALGRYQYRAWQLRNPSQTGRFDDLYGPPVLCVLVVGALVINFWLRFKYVPPHENNIYPPPSNTTL